MTAKKTIVILLLVSLLSLFSFSSPAYALDKRLKLMFKTAGYGAAAGLVVGGATWVLGMGGFRNALMGASAGMYAGVLLAAYIVATPTESEEDLKKKNPFAPKQKIGPDDWKDEPDESRTDTPKVIPKALSDSLVKPMLSHPSSLSERTVAMAPQVGLSRPHETKFWAPMVSLSF